MGEINGDDVNCVGGGKGVQNMNKIYDQLKERGGYGESNNHNRIMENNFLIDGRQFCSFESAIFFYCSTISRISDFLSRG